MFKDYLNAEERNQLMVYMAVLQISKGVRTMTNQAKGEGIVEAWEKRNNLTKDEKKSIKMALTYMEKFCKSVYDRMGDKEKNAISKRLGKFDFRLIDDYTLQKIYRESKDRMVNAVVPREEFQDWCSEIMEVNCKSCTKDYKECDLHDIFEENFIPEPYEPSGPLFLNCRYAYTREDKSE